MASIFAILNKIALCNPRKLSKNIVQLCDFQLKYIKMLINSMAVLFILYEKQPNVGNELSLYSIIRIC